MTDDARVVDFPALLARVRSQIKRNGTIGCDTMDEIDAALAGVGESNVARRTNEEIVAAGQDRLLDCLAARKAGLPGAPICEPCNTGHPERCLWRVEPPVGRSRPTIAEEAQELLADLSEYATVPRMPLNQNLFEIANAVREEIQDKAPAADLATCLIRHQAAWDRILKAMSVESPPKRQIPADAEYVAALEEALFRVESIALAGIATHGSRDANGLSGYSLRLWNEAIEHGKVNRRRNEIFNRGTLLPGSAPKVGDQHG